MMSTLTATASNGTRDEHRCGAAKLPIDSAAGLERFAAEQLFEEDVRAVLRMMRPNRRERLLGWHEYRTGGAHFRATISWDNEFARDDGSHPFAVPHLVDVLEAVLVGSIKTDADLLPADEFDLYRQVVRELYKRLNEAQACYE